MASSATGERSIDRFSRPTKSQLKDHVIPSVCTNWFNLGLELFDPKDENKVDIIETSDRIHGVETCCRKMLDEWLKYDNANWDQLVRAIRKIGLNHAASEIEKLFKLPAGTDTTMQETSVTSSSNVATSARTTITQNQAEILNKKPEMFDLQKIVIPKIMNVWEYVAEALRYDIPTIQAIKNKEHEDPKKCCREFFKDWLTTKNGARAGPKVWSTLFDALKAVDEISTDTAEAIIAEVNQLK